MKSFIPKKISKDQAKDTGMAMVLICFLLGFYIQKQGFFTIGIVLLLVDMIYPNLYRPAATIWFGLSNVLGTISSKLILTVIFFVIVTPVGLIRRLIVADSMQLKRWKKDDSSVFEIREHIFQPEDIEKPY
ncbi:MAG: hypothetical protein IT393_05860 [Nitrospirae bacterium]|nr:hypothetical protein [Nitrospirota bacterium]